MLSNGEKDAGEQSQIKKDLNDHFGEPLGMHGVAEKKGSKAGQSGGDPDGGGKSEGTGEQWVKSSGMAGDGGYFNATKLGAGHEADRLLEQKGIKCEPGRYSPIENTNAPKDSRSKCGMDDKIKGIFYKG
ncbi:MAG: hypothetical protein M1827_007511 [Pycnora praestabilis]|nr:MAG: hypothetical protein M1827_007511 [Pycnora praestabilis]